VRGCDVAPDGPFGWYPCGMSYPAIVLLALFVGMGVTVQRAEGQASATDNPLLAESGFPHDHPAFDRIENGHYAPAFDRAIAEHRREVAAIASAAAVPTFENTIVGLERSGQLLDRVRRIFFNLVGTHTNPEMQAVERDLAPRLAAHSDAIRLDAALFRRIEALYRQRASLPLDAESLRLLERYHTEFVRAGARLSEADKERLKAMNAELATLQTQFTQNVLAEVNASAVLVEDRAALDGMSDAEIAGMAQAAAARGHVGRYLVALQNTTGQPPLSSLRHRDLRRRIHEASVARGSRGGEYDNREVVRRMITLRAERARLLGYRDHATYVLEDNTAGTPGAVNDMHARLGQPAVANARRDATDLQRMIDADGGGFPLAAWDWSFYAERLRQERYAFDESHVRPYFELNRVLEDGVFFSAHRLFGLTFRARPDLPVYQEDVRVWEVFDDDGSSLGLFIGDFHARPTKRGGAWMNAYVAQSGLLGTRAVVANHLNIPKPGEGEPTLMTFDQVRTLFHEFGHALHGLFSNVRYPRFAGTSVPRDFVEFPSQVYAMWAMWPEVLANYARHYRTGEPIPQDLLDRVLAAERFNQGFRTTEYLAASIIDQALHQLAPDQIPDDLMAFEVQTLSRAGMDFAPVPPRYRTTYFSHAFGGGYHAGYYSYIWSEVLDADAVEWFKERGGMTRANGQHFRDTLLSRGFSEDPMQQFRDLTGRDPRIEPLLVRRGLTGN
jgi:peptidyl-dipeptidase Dcp